MAALFLLKTQRDRLPIKHERDKMIYKNEGKGRLPGMMTGISSNERALFRPGKQGPRKAMLA